MSTIPDLCHALQALLIQDADRLGRTSGFIQRQRKWSGASFVQSLVFGWQANPQASLEELCQSAAICGVKISPQGLQERLNSPQAAQFLQQMLEHSLTYLVTSTSEAPGCLKQFSGVYLQDSTTIGLPASLAWKRQPEQQKRRAESANGLQLPEWTVATPFGSAHDCPLQTVDLPPGSLRLADVGYFKVKVFEELNRRAVWWLTRLPARAGVWVDDRVVNLATWLTEHCPHEGLDVEVELTAQRFCCRLIAQRVPAAVAARRREHVQAEAADRPSKLRPETLALCD